jgi:hypothetical protein
MCRCSCGPTIPGGGASLSTAPPLAASSSTVAAAPSAPASAPAAGAAPLQPAPPLATTGGGSSASQARQGVLLIGDSLSVGTKQYLDARMAGQPVKIDATSGISLAEGMRRYDATANKPRVVEMALFTNNSPGQIDQLRTALEKTVTDARARGGIVVWATIVRPGDYGPANALIRDMAAKHPDVMRVVDWEKMVRDNPSYLAGDKVHGTPAGYQARARAFADAAR